MYCMYLVKEQAVMNVRSGCGSFLTSSFSQGLWLSRCDLASIFQEHTSYETETNTVIEEHFRSPEEGICKLVSADLFPICLVIGMWLELQELFRSNKSASSCWDWKFEAATFGTWTSYCEHGNKFSYWSRKVPKWRICSTHWRIIDLARKIFKVQKA